MGAVGRSPSTGTSHSCPFWTYATVTPSGEIAAARGDSRHSAGSDNVTQRDPSTFATARRVRPPDPPEGLVTISSHEPSDDQPTTCRT
jgi:hypothetical protein